MWVGGNLKYMCEWGGYLTKWEGGSHSKFFSIKQASLFKDQIDSATNSDHFDDHNDNITTDIDDDGNHLCAGQIVLLPSPPQGSPGVRGKICVIIKGGALENEAKRGRGTLK